MNRPPTDEKAILEGVLARLPAFGKLDRGRAEQLVGKLVFARIDELTKIRSNAMKITAANKSYKIGGFWGALMAVLIICTTFSIIAAVFLAVVSILLSPVILLLWLILR